MPGSWSDFLKLRWGPAPPPSPEAGSVRVYADAAGALRTVQPDGTDAAIGGGGTFNGGTITNPLAIDVPLSGVDAIRVTADDLPLAVVDMFIGSDGSVGATFVADLTQTAAISLQDQDSGHIFLQTASGSFIAPASSSGDSDVVIELRDKTGSPVFKVTAGGSIIATIPAADPHIAGALYSTAGVVHVSAG